VKGRLLSCAALALWVLLVDAWFRGPLLGRFAGPTTAGVLAALLLVVVAVSVARSRERWPDRRFALIVASMLALATLVRLPALLVPSSVISGDSAVNGIIAHELRVGAIAPPVYPPGYPYEGTLKVNLTALLGRLLPSVATPPIYIGLGHAFYLLWMAAAMALARRAAGDVGAVGAGLFMALSPRFLTAFSVNNVGQYQELNALGTLGLALIPGGQGLLLAAFAVGLAVWQQLVAVYFVLTLAIAVLVTPALRAPSSLASGLAGFAAGTYPMWIWNLANEWATFDFFRRGGKGGPLDRVFEMPTQLGRTLSISFPKMFGVTDMDLAGGAAVLLALMLPALVLVMAWSRRAEIRERRGQSAVFVAVVLFTVALSVFTVSKFSRRGIQRPRYLLPLYTPIAVAAGWGLAGLAKRSKAVAVGAATLVVGWNVAGTLPWLAGRGPAAAHDRAFLARLDALGIRRGSAGFTLATRYTFLSDGGVVIAGDLGPEVDWVYLPHAHRVATEGADAYFATRPDLAEGLARRLDALGVAYQRTEGLPAVFHALSRRVELSELDGYDAGADAPDAAAAEGEAE
jgi:hypothetical protein